METIAARHGMYLEPVYNAAGPSRWLISASLVNRGQSEFRKLLDSQRDLRVEW
jgi:hypothetical protein